MYKYLVFEDRVGHFTRNSYFLQTVRNMDWKSYDDFLFGYTSSIKDLKECDPKTIKLYILNFFFNKKCFFC